MRLSKKIIMNAKPFVPVESIVVSKSFVDSKSFESKSVLKPSIQTMKVPQTIQMVLKGRGINIIS